MLLCYHASHEQFAPSMLLRLAILAEKAGFGAIHSSDHFYPWTEKNGQSGFSFSWIAAAMQATQLPFSMICAPGQRYHPAIVAQAFATLAEMFPGRFTGELGSGEAINESVSGLKWPDKQTRNKRLKICYQIIKALLAGKKVETSGLVTTGKSKLFTLPSSPPLLFGAALSKDTTAFIAPWVDGLLTSASGVAETKEKMDTFKLHGGDHKPVFLQFAFSYATTKKDAAQGAFENWRNNLLPSSLLATLPHPKEFDKQGKRISMSDIEATIPFVTSIEELVDVLAPYTAPRPDRIILHNVNCTQEMFINAFGENVSLLKLLT